MKSVKELVTCEKFPFVLTITSIHPWSSEFSIKILNIKKITSGKRRVVYDIRTPNI